MVDFIEKILQENSIDVGEVLFGDISRIAKYQNKPYEENTEIETELFEVLDQYIRMTNNKEEVKSIIPKLKQLKSKFPKVLIPENKSVFRGTAVESKILKTLIKQHGYSESKINPKWLELNTEIDYKSESTITSWTSNINVAIRFSKTNEQEKITFDKVSSSKVIISTNPDDSFVLNPNFSNLISSLHNLGREYETISVKNKFTNCIVYFEKLFL